MITDNDINAAVQKIMDEVQVFACAYSLIGSRFDNGNQDAETTEIKKGLTDLITNAIKNAAAMSGEALLTATSDNMRRSPRLALHCAQADPHEIATHEKLAGDLHEEKPLNNIGFVRAMLRMATPGIQLNAAFYQALLVYIQHTGATVTPAKDMDPSSMLPMSEVCINAVHRVYFRAGLLAARELLADLVEPTDAILASTLRSHWWPKVLDTDPGPPRKLHFHELADGGEEGPWTLRDDISPSLEALSYAALFVAAVQLPEAPAQ